MNNASIRNVQYCKNVMDSVEMMGRVIGQAFVSFLFLQSDLRGINLDRRVRTTANSNEKKRRSGTAVSGCSAKISSVKNLWELAARSGPAKRLLLVTVVYESIAKPCQKIVYFC